MEIIDLSKNKKDRFNTAIALGNFDGIHLGHQDLIKTMIDNASNLGLESSVLLFKDHTRKTINRDEPRHITSTQQKIKIMEQLGVEKTYLINFNEALMKLSPRDFIKNILIEKINTKLVVVGFNYRFGYKAEGDIDCLIRLSNELDFKVNVLPPIKKDGVIISSSNIRSLIQNGEVLRAKEMLGREYSISGEVIKGENRGHILGFPTANMKVINYVIPKTGVYKTLTIVDNKEYLSATNIGYNPTFENKGLKFETHILNFDQRIYGKNIQVKFISYIRDDIKFNNKKDLVDQMNMDIKKIREQDIL